MCSPFLYRATVDHLFNIRIKQRMCQVPVYNMPVKCVVILYCMRPRPGELYRVVQAVLVVSVLGGYKQIGGYEQV